MCGLCGVIGDIDLDDKKAFDLLLKLDVTRGRHSTGIARIPIYHADRHKAEVVKGVGTPWDLIDNIPEAYYNDKHKYPGPNLLGGYIALMGHNRYATVGAINEKNAHPFEAGKIIGAQNGTLPKASIELLDDYEYYDTDTEALMFNIDLHGVENVIPKITGAWALTWYDRDEDSFNILRNKERPLHFAWKKGGKVMYYASEAWMLFAISNKFNIEFEEDAQGNDVFSFAVDTHYKFVFPKFAMSFNKNDCLTKTELKGATPVSLPKVTYTVVSSGTAKESSNVFLKNSEGSASSSVDAWLAKKGEWVEFTVDGTFMRDEQRKEFIVAKSVEGGADIRIYPSVNNPQLIKTLDDLEVCTFASTIKKIKTVGKKFYLTIDLDKIMACTYNGAHYKGEKVNDDIPFLANLFDNNASIPVWNGELIPADEFDRKMKKGCAWCSHQPETIECKDIHWMNRDDFLCSICASNDETMRYVNHYTK